MGAHGQSVGVATHGTRRLEQLSLYRLCRSPRRNVLARPRCDKPTTGSAFCRYRRLRDRCRDCPPITHAHAGALVRIGCRRSGLGSRTCRTATSIYFSRLSIDHRCCDVVTQVGVCDRAHRVDCPSRCPDGVLGNFVCDFSIAEREAVDTATATELPSANHWTTSTPPLRYGPSH